MHMHDCVCLSEYKECFSLFDRDHDGFINREELEVILRSLGQNATYVEIDKMVSDIGMFDLYTDQSETKVLIISPILLWLLCLQVGYKMRSIKYLQQKKGECKKKTICSYTLFLYKNVYFRGCAWMFLILF